MGATISISENPKDQSLFEPTTLISVSASNMPSNSQNPDPKADENQTPDPKTLETQNPEISNKPTNPDEKGQVNDEEKSKKAEEEEEEEGECGFCLFMKGGGCKDEFVAWELCVEKSEKNGEDIVEKCFEATSNLKKCMEAHPDYYEPILRAEKAAEEEVKQEIERESESKNVQQNSDSKAVEESAEIEVQEES